MITDDYEWRTINELQMYHVASLHKDTRPKQASGKRRCERVAQDRVLVDGGGELSSVYSSSEGDRHFLVVEENRFLRDALFTGASSLVNSVCIVY